MTLPATISAIWPGRWQPTTDRFADFDAFMMAARIMGTPGPHEGARLGALLVTSVVTGPRVQYFAETPEGMTQGSDLRDVLGRALLACGAARDAATGVTPCE